MEFGRVTRLKPDRLCGRGSMHSHYNLSTADTDVGVRNRGPRARETRISHTRAVFPSKNESYLKIIRPTVTLTAPALPAVKLTPQAARGAKLSFEVAARTCDKVPVIADGNNASS